MNHINDIKRSLCTAMANRQTDRQTNKLSTATIIFLPCHLQESEAIRNLIITHNQYVESLDKSGDETSALNHLQQCLEYSQRIDDKEAVASCKYKVSKTR